jgi:hypothetical protein
MKIGAISHLNVNIVFNMENINAIELKQQNSIVTSKNIFEAIQGLKIETIQRQIALARLKPKIGDLPRDKQSENLFLHSLKGLIMKTYADCGQIPSNESYFVEGAEIKPIKFQVQELSDDIDRSFTNLTLDEIYIAFSEGVRGIYGEFYGLNNVTYFKWLKSYKESETRRNALFELNKLREPVKLEFPQKVYSNSEIYEMNKLNIIDFYYNYFLKEKECITFPYSLIYKTLDCCKIINYSVNERIEMYKKAQFVLESKLRNERAKGTIKASKMEFEIKEIQEPKSQKVIIKAQEMLVNKFFEMCKQQFKEMGIKFEENFTEESKLQFNLNYESIKK